MNTRVKVIGICGSMRSTSYTQMALALALAGAEELGADTELIHLKDYELVFCNAVDTDELPEDVHRLRNKVSEAQGIILGTPEYHGGYSGVLKNALDLMSCEQFEGKMLGLVGVSAGALGATDAINSLRNVGRSLHAWVVPEQVSIPFVDKVFSPAGECLDSGIEARLRGLGKQIGRFAYLHSSSRAMDFIKAWEEAPNNPGGEY